jgi:hypothetical protein
VAEWTARFQSAGQEKGEHRVLTMRGLFEEIVATDGREGFENHDRVAESLRHGEYFVENADFSDVKYWLSV